jgi:hypothetical protein
LIPQAGETGWATPVTGILQDLGTNAVSLTGSQTVTNKILQSAAGTAGSPSVSFAGDTDTGLFHPNANQVAVATNGVQVITFDASGNLILQTGGLISSTHELGITTDDAHDIVFKPNSSEAMRIASGGVVTVGNTPSTSDNSTKVANTSFVQSVLSATPNQNIGRNRLHNPLFNNAQRGAGPWTATGYTLDRWVVGITTDSASWTQVSLSDADRTAIGDESAAVAFQNVFTGSSSAGAYNQLVQRTENVRLLAGKTVTVSFWAKANSGTPSLGINILQGFGTGGSPSTAVRALATGNSVTLSTTWTRYTSTIAIPSISGKTLGSNGDHSTQLEIFYSSGSTNNAVAGNIGVQSGTIKIWGVQLEVGAAATPLEIRDQGVELALCQRFYQTSQMFAIGYNASTGNIFGTYLLPTTMRATPSTTITNQSYANASAFTGYNVQSTIVVVQATVTSTGQASGAATVALSADL